MICRQNLKAIVSVINWFVLQQRTVYYLTVLKCAQKSISQVYCLKNPFEWECQIYAFYINDLRQFHNTLTIGFRGLRQINETNWNFWRFVPTTNRQTFSSFIIHVCIFRMENYYTPAESRTVNTYMNNEFFSLHMNPCSYQNSSPFYVTALSDQIL